MGEVYLAEDIRLGHKVAIKRLSEHLVADRTHRQRFEREARAVAHLTHPNILTLLEFDEIDSDLILVTEYVPGGTLEEIIEEHPDGVDLKSFFRWATQAADGLAVAHSQDVLHRDIKPANLLVTQAGDLRIADFGLSLLAAETQITQPGAVMGTLAYMAPEQLRGERVDGRADLFSLGATYLELLYGRGADAGPKTHAMAELQPSSLRERRPEIPPALEELVLQMLEQDPTRRIASAKEVGSRLRSIASGVELSESLPVRVGGVPRESRRRWLAVAVVVLVLAAWFIQRSWFAESAPDPDGIRAVAVLPLRDVSLDGAAKHLAAGLTEALMVDLSRIRSISVISRRSAEQLANSTLSMPEIAKRLGADVVLEGSVSRVGDHIKVTAILVDGAMDRNIWVSDFEADLEDFFTLQRDIARAIATGIGAEITSHEQAILTPPRSVDPRAIELYLQARALWRQRSGESIEASAALFAEIVDANPDFAEAWVGLAEVQIVLPTYANLTPRETYPEARRCALEALEVDPANAEAWSVLSEVAYIYDLDYPECERLRLKSLDLNPGSVTTHQWHAEFLGAMGRHEEALAEIKIAQRLDPLSPLMMTVEGQVLIYARRFEDAGVVLRQVLTAYPDFELARIYLAWALRHSGRFEEAAQEYIAWQRLIGTSEEKIQELEAANETRGYVGMKLVLLEQQVRRLQSGEFTKARGLASAYAEQGDIENSLRWLERSFRDRDIALLRLKVNADFDGMREDPRFIEIMGRIGFGD